MSSFYQLMMRKKGIDYSKIPLTFMAEEGSSTITLSVTGTPTYNLKYSVDGVNWSTFADSDTSTINTVTLSNIGDMCYIKGSYSGQSANNNIKFIMAGKISASGNLYSILDENNFKNIKNLSSYNSYTFRSLFENQTSLVSSKNLILQATTLKNDCYFRLFYNCSNMTDIPELPATTLVFDCYVRMFQGCSLITKANLPATTLGIDCYYRIFEGCSNLKEIRLGYTGNFNSNFSGWVYNASPSGVLYYNGTDTTVGTSAIPSGWTVQSF